MKQEDIKQTITNEIGSIEDTNGTQLVRMWKADVPSGKRPRRHHYHFNFEIMYVNSGSGVYTTSNAEYPMQPGDVFVFSSNEFHLITNIGTEGLQITNLHFNPQFIRSFRSDNNTNINLQLCFSHHPDFCNRIPADNATKLLPILLQLEEEFIHQNVEYVLSIKTYIQFFLISLVRNHNYLDLQTNVTHEQIHTIQRTLKFIDEHFSEKITLQEISSLARLSPTYFSALFKQVVGLSLWSYINSKRIDKAARLITSENFEGNMLEVAIECGFNNTANFNKTFKKITGMTPSEYKKGGHGEIS